MAKDNRSFKSKYQGKGDVDRGDNVVIPHKQTLIEIFEEKNLHLSVKRLRNVTRKEPFEFFCWLFEREKPYQKQKLISKTNKNNQTKKYWEWKYADDFIYKAMRFCWLSHDEQKYVIAAREDGVYWRGEDIDTYREIYDSTMTWREQDSGTKESKVAVMKATIIKQKG